MVSALLGGLGGPHVETSSAKVILFTGLVVAGGITGGNGGGGGGGGEGGGGGNDRQLS